MVETGIVIWFDKRERKEFGFLQLTDGSQLFFHLHDACEAYGTIEVHFDIASPFPIWGHPDFHLPEKGDRIVFKRGESRDGRPKADPWIYEFEWNKVEDKIAENFRQLELKSSTRPH